MKSRKLIAGVDEVGRGSLVGSVFSAAVIFKPDIHIKGLKDSKKTSPKNRLILSNNIIIDTYSRLKGQTTLDQVFITENLIDLLKVKGFTVSPYKPIETGCKKIKAKLIPSDASKFHKLINKEIDIDLINPYRFQQPISPNRAIRLAKKKIFIKDYIDKSKLLPKNNYLIIEGAGGLYSPISTDGYNIDLIKKMKIPTVLVAKDEIGVINNILLSLDLLLKHKIL